MLVHLPIVILTSLQPVAVTDGIPKFDIAQQCQSEAGPSKEAEDKCAKDEKQARDQVQREWSQFAPRAKALCSAEAGAGGATSYVELLTCLEMERDARKESK